MIKLVLWKKWGETNFEGQMCLGEAQLCAALWNYAVSKEQGWKRGCQKTSYSQINIAWLNSKIILKLNVIYDDLYLIFIVCCVIQKKITVSSVAWKTFWNKYAGSKNVMSHQHEIMLGIHRKGYNLLGKRHNTVSEKQSQLCFVFLFSEKV